MEQFKKKYIKNFSIKIWSKSINHYSNKIEKLKSEKWKEDYIFLLYTKYLQLIENFLIFLLVCFDENWIEIIFYRNNKIEEKYKDFFSLKWENITLKTKIVIEDIIKSYIVSNHNEYKKLILESLKDYLEYRDLLNCYKHWFRLDNIWKNSWSASIWENKFHMGEFNSWIIFFTKKLDIIYRNSLSFNYEYINLKSAFVVNLIENIKLNYLNPGKKINITTLKVIDDTIKTKYWSFHLKNPIFKIVNTHE